MHPEAVRVVFESQPYLVIRASDGSLERAYGPFAPGTEPSLDGCSDENRIHDPTLLAALHDLLPISPVVPPNKDTLAAG